MNAFALILVNVRDKRKRREPLNKTPQVLTQLPLYTRQTMTHKDLQAILKEYRAIGYDLQVKLNATTQLLQTELNRLQSNPQICELTSAVRLPLVLPEVETPRDMSAEFIQEIKTQDAYWLTWNAAYCQAIDSLNAPSQKQYHHDVFPSKLSQMTHGYNGVLALAVLFLLTEIFCQGLAITMQKLIVKKLSNKKVYGFNHESFQLSN